MNMETNEENENDNINNDYVDLHRLEGFFSDDLEIDESECQMINVYVIKTTDELNDEKSLSIANLAIHETKKCDKSSIKTLAAERDTLKKKLNSVSSIHEKFDQFRRSSKFCDVTLFATDSKDIIPVHKLVLASHSSVLLEIFDTNGTNFIYTNYDINTLQTVLLWMYNIVSEITVKHYNFLPLLALTIEWQIQYIEDQCLNYIKQNPDDFESYFSYFSNGLNTCFSPDYDICPFIIKYFGELPESFIKLICANLAKIYIHTIISDDNLACSREEKIYDFIIKWVRHDEEKRKQYLWELIECLRLPFMSEDYLSKIICEPLLGEYALTIKDRAQKLSLMIGQMQSDNLNFYTQHKDDKDYKRRIPEFLGKSKVILAVRNQWEMMDTSPVEYLDVIVNDYEQNIVQFWKPLADSVFRPRRELSKLIAFEDDGLVFAVGGLSANNRPTCQMDMIDLSFFSHTWISSPSMSFARSNPAVCNDDRYIYVVGGVGVDGMIPRTIEIFDTISSSWNTSKQQIKQHRTNPSITCKNGVLYIVGGIDDQGNPKNLIDIIDTVNGNRTEIYVTDYFNDTCTTVLNSNLFVIGGRYTKKKHCETSDYAQVLHFDGRLFHCRRSKCLVVEREKASVVVIDDNLYVFGGINSKQEPILETEILDFYSKHIGGPINGMTAKFTDQNVIVLSKKLLEYTKILLNENE